MNQTGTVKALLESGVGFKEHYVNLSTLDAIPNSKYREDIGAGSKRNLLNVNIALNGKEFKPTTRFWTSFCAKVGVSPSVFNLYSHKEVLERVVNLQKFSRTGDVRIVEDVKNGSLLAISDCSKPIVDWKNTLNLVDKMGGYDVKYHDGILTSTHALASDLGIKVGSEDYKQRISVNIPVDGYGSPAVYLALLRMVCANGQVMESKAFKTTVNVGKKDSSSDIEYSLERMFNSFSNDEGFDALIRRLDSARLSKLSVREYTDASTILSAIKDKTSSSDDLRISSERRKFSDMAGNLHHKYGLSHLQQMTDKQMSLLETDMTVYEAVTFLSEVTTHSLDRHDSNHNAINRRINGWVGGLVSRSYDLEGIIDLSDAKDSCQDFFLRAN